MPHLSHFPVDHGSDVGMRRKKSRHADVSPSRAKDGLAPKSPEITTCRTSGFGTERG